MVEISPSILSADFARLGEQLDTVRKAGARMIHVDVMDGHFVPNISIGIPVVESLKKSTDLLLDCHLMITNPESYLEAFAQAGAKMITVHQETCPHLGSTVKRIKELGAVAGVALNPATSLTTLEEVLPDLDLVLIMSVHPGFGGQSFISSSLDKIKRLDTLRHQQNLKFRIQVDGGVNRENVTALCESGCDILVAGSSIFNTDSPGEAMQELSRLAKLTDLVKA